MGRKRTGSEFTCPACGKLFYRPACQIKRQKQILGCSPACKGLLTMDGEHRICQQCGRSFYLNKSRAAKVAGLYCSNACNGLAVRKFVAVTCAWCKKDLLRPPNQLKPSPRLQLPKNHFCDRSCTLEWKRRFGPRAGRGAFSAKQKSQWMEACCRNCGATEELELDHIVPKFAGGKHTRDNAQTLCRTCNRNKFWKVDQYLYTFDRP